MKASRAELRTTIEQMETTNEELKASNEEATSMNEELQSTNEELETSKEELQSFNEELNTVNSQLQHKIGELEHATNDLNNLLAGSDTATLFLDTHFRVKWFSPATKAQFDLVSSDIGRPIGHFARKFSDKELLTDAETVLRKLTTIEAEVPSDSGRWYLRRMLPYRTLDNHIAGVVIAFSDITAQKQAADAVNEARIYAEAIVQTVRQPLLVLDGDLRVQSANSAFYNLFKVAKNEAEGRLIYEIGSSQWNIPALRTLLEAVIPKDEQVTDFEIEHDYRDIGSRSLLFNARRLARNGGRDNLILLSIEDATEHRRSEAALRESETQYRALFDSIDEGFCIIERTDTQPGTPIDFRYIEANPAFESQSGIADVVGKTIRDVVPGESEEWLKTYDAVLKSGEPIRFERGLITNGRVLELYAFPLEGIRRRRLAVIFQDITARKRAEAAGEQLAAIVGSSDDAIISKNTDGIIASWNKAAERLFGYTADEIIGKSIMLLIPTDRHEEEVDILESIRRDEHIDHFETIRLRKDGSHVWVSLSVSPLKDAEGKIIGASKIARDMTERRRADEHRKIMVGELNHRVKTRWRWCSRSHHRHLVMRRRSRKRAKPSARDC
ncbi:PAS domain S-box protein [Mesorhizobium sp. PAMC28654]|uniref:PAS domain S-box protein n=1 Tax=Mesorhizobium sp. PAMC28654 TaxID=2880934 RepID=UPI001D0A6BF1|nr:PAS domain S-box protein [Mesorhizobium sp. PAMC28654]UDL89338.1 PAS domain S-box protein [Mesorhizobium sp. PAMC28654]